MYEDPIWDRSRCDFNKLRIHYAIVVIRGTNFLSLSFWKINFFTKEKIGFEIDRERDSTQSRDVARRATSDS